jgi:MFS family permease
MMRLRPRPRRVHATHPLRDLKEGFLYVAGSPPIRAVLLMMGLLSLLAIPYSVLLPVFAGEVLSGGPHVEFLAAAGGPSAEMNRDAAVRMGFLVAAGGLGAVVGAVFLASQRSMMAIPRLIAAASAIFGIGLIAFALSANLYLSLGLLMVVGFGMMVQLVSSNTLLQTVADEDKRGRVMSFHTMAFMGMAPLGSLIAGAMAKVLGAPDTVLACGAVSILGAVVFAAGLGRIHRSLRPMLEAKGFLPPMSGISTPIPAAGAAPVAGPEPAALDDSADPGAPGPPH